MKKVKLPSKNQLARLWLEEYYIDKIKRCGLCRNKGIIEKWDKKYWCICPNGRILRKNLGIRP